MIHSNIGIAILIMTVIIFLLVYLRMIMIIFTQECFSRTMKQLRKNLHAWANFEKLLND